MEGLVCYNIFIISSEITHHLKTGHYTCINS